MTVIAVLTLVIGLLLGAVIGYLAARNREAGARTDLAARASAADERARAAEQRTALVDGQLAAEATLMCKMVDREPGQKEAGQKAKDTGK